MPLYRAMINGENFLVEIEGTLGKYGFFTNRCVTADDSVAAENAAVQVMRDDERLRGLVRNTPDDPPTLQVESLQEIESADPGVPAGLAWYEMKPKRWWQFWKRVAEFFSD